MSLLLGLRLAVAGGREALIRFVFTAIGVAVALTLLLLALTAPSAVTGRVERTLWQDAAYAAAWPEDWPEPPVRSADGALFLAVSDYYDGTPMTRAYVAALGDDPPVPPGLERLPGPGEVAASPAMRRLLATTPDDQLDDRFPGRVTLTIGEAGLRHDNELVAIVGRTPEQLREVRSVEEVHGFLSPGSVPIGPPGVLVIPLLLAPFLLMGAVLLLVPAAILVIIVTRVAWAQREQRLAAIRLVGATRRQIAVVAAAETGLAAVAGAALAWAGYEAGRRILAAAITFQGGHFWLDDLAVPPTVLGLVLLGAPVLVMLTAVVSLRSVQRGPLAISRRSRRPAPSAWPLLLVVIGVGGAFALEPLKEVFGTNAELAAGTLTILTMVGLVMTGPWMCMMVGRGVARISRGVPGLIAARRIAVDPGATFRAVSGVVLAVAAVTYIGSSASQVEPFAEAPESESSLATPLRPGVVQVYTGGVPQQRVAPLLTDQAVTIRASSGGFEVACAELARVRYVSCPFADGPGLSEPGPGVENLPVHDLFIPTDGTLAAENRVRTRAANLVPNAIINTDRDPVNQDLALFVDVDRLASVAGLFVLLMGALSLTAGMIGGLLERRRPFALLRAAGMRIGELRRVVFLETVATMVVTSVIGMGLGMLLAYVSSRRGGGAWQWPDLAVYVYVGSGVLIALGFSAFALPLLGTTSRYNAVRYE